MRSDRSNPRFPSVRLLGTGRALAALAALLLVGPTGCGESDGPPVGSLRVEPRELTLAHSTVSELHLRWDFTSDLGEVSGEPLVFVHLLDQEGRLTRTFDHPLPGGWTTGQEREYTTRIYQSALAPPLPPGTYTLTIGLYDGAGTRWPLDVEGERVADREYAVGRVTVPSEPANLPELGFSPGWTPTLAGGDRQVLALRWLTGDGAVLVEDPSGSRMLWLQLRIPTPGEVGARRIFRPDASEPRTPSVRVAAPCSGFEAFVTGTGSHHLAVPVEQNEGGRCVIRLEPNFAMVADGVEQETVMLQNLAWEEASRQARDEDASP